MNEILALFALLGTAVFAVSGALLGLRKEMDIVGVSFVATVTGVGGGTIRDLLLGATPVAWVREPTVILLCIACAFGVSLLNRWLIGRRMQWLLYADAAGLSLFAVLGASTALAAEAHPFVAVLFGAMSASFGGVIRDVMCDETPVIFSHEIYITPALLGAAVFTFAPFGLAFEPRAALGVIAALALRLLAIQRGWSVPFPRYARHDTSPD
ncbi:trimeric intracellular cation channel family protein [Parvularcula oceani]|uniref:trimeric intracellular cation channel family protein n=1 Tax=Parvularcula oceani TaxID=1247963 RepID=UPI0004E0FA83|nr:trimeric intracellular cation channel family protein [Parvularcula oceani]